MQEDEHIGIGGILFVMLVAFIACLGMLFAIDPNAVGDLENMIAMATGAEAESAVAEQPRQRTGGYYTEYDFEAYYAEKQAEGDDVDEFVAKSGSAKSGATKTRKKGGGSRRLPEIPEGLKLGNARVKTVTGEDSRIEIIDIGGSMEPVDIYEETGAGITGAAPGSIASRSKYWPMPNRLHHAAKSAPQSLQSYQDAAAYIGRHESNDVQRVKAIHDYLTLRLSYDYDSLKPGRRKSQQPKAVFDSGLAVCEGYARLFKAMAVELGIEAEYVSGLSRQWMDRGLSNQRHAWNTVKLDGKWYLVDATWGDDDNGLYSTDYLFVPGEVLSATHFPSNPRWQLRKKPISRSQFYRGAHLLPAFHAAGLDLVSPRQGEVSASGDLVRIEIDNPANSYLHASIRPRGDRNGPRERCDVQGTSRLTVRCPVKLGRQTVVFFAGPSRRSVKFVGAMHVRR